MRNALDLRRLRYFAAIAEHGSLSGAARALNVAQPALSHHIRQIEAALDLALLERHRDGVTLTDAGRLLEAHARTIMAAVERAEDELAALAPPAPPALRLRIAIISSIAAELTPLLLAQFQRTMPGVAVRITEAGTLDSRELIDKGTVDLAIALSPSRRAVPVASERLHLVSRAEGEGDDGDIAFAEVLPLPLILPARGNPLRELIEAEAATAGRRLDVVFEIDGPTSRTRALSSGQGHTILGATSTAELARTPGLVVRAIVAPAIRRPLYMDARQGLPADLVDSARRALAAALASMPSLDPVG
ncbi:LysR family transcriptional regulator [Flavisphingomonas formosensis]|uniref:LysR family transcriptional regulator n=1 Tax=Flavisphingomonas formosensis TaxID=861534 RepID=UPI0018DF3F98|nr:LysR family transcriptional regulator [Sphingomonas formosensis]